MKKIFKIFIIIVVLVLIIFIGNIIRKFYIIHKIENNLLKVSKSENYSFVRKENYHYTENSRKYTYRRLGETKIFEKDDKIKAAEFSRGDTYIFDYENKTYMKAKNSFIEEFDTHFKNYIFGEKASSIIEQLKIAIKAKIRTRTTSDEIRCYEIVTSVNEINYFSYINKENLLLIESGILTYARWHNIS